ncbi:ComF family protein [Intestinibacter bartlettii]|nr:ComF family protein [Intestinibacter bartlettii]MDO5010827.1 ComF family protein [Intestinibacter bartlettii]
MKTIRNKIKNNIENKSDIRLIIKDMKNSLLDFIYPQNIACIICDKPIKLTNTYSICKDCFKELHFLKDACMKCGKPIINHNLEYEDISNCSYCRQRTFYFDRAISCIEYNQTSKKMILDFKYKNKTYFCRYVAQIMSEKMELENITADYLLFVPLHKKRLRKRGFNQAEKIAQDLSDITGIPTLNCIFRKKNTKRLYNLNRLERQQEVKNSFIIKDNDNLLKNKNVILVDDIFTTGSTSNEISKMLKLIPVNKIIVLALLTRTNDPYVSFEENN